MKINDGEHTRQKYIFILFEIEFLLRTCCLMLFKSMNIKKMKMKMKPKIEISTEFLFHISH